MTAARVAFSEKDYRSAIAEREAKTVGREAPDSGRGLVAPVPPAVFPVVRVLEGEAPDPPAVLVDDLLVDRDVNEWAGHGGAAKSVLALMLAVCVALGRRVFGTLAVRRSGPVLIVAPEDGLAAVRMMLDALVEGLGLDATDRATLAARLLLVPDAESVNLCTDTGRLRDTAKACGAVLVILDPLRNLLGGADENDNAIAGAVLDALRRDVCRDAGATVLILHHSRKPGKEQGPDVGPSVHEMRGAGAWAAGARLVFGIANKAGHVTMTALKANRLRSDLRHELRLSIEADPAMPTRWLSCTVTDLNGGLDSESYTPGLARALTPNEQTALAALDDAQEPGTRLSWSTWLRRSGLKDDTFNKLKSRLVGAGLALSENTGKHTPRGGPIYTYGISATGRALLARDQASP